MDKRYFISEKNNYAQKMTGTVEPYLREHEKCGYFKGWDGNDMFYVRYTRRQPKGNVVVVHGFTESSEKFNEMFWYFLHMGYNVFAYDHRGHGRSFRYNNDPETIAINKFEEYVDDLKCYLDQIVIPESDGLPLYIYSHSMGGAVSIQFLQTYPDIFSKAVLSAPMVAANTANIPPVPATIVMTALRTFAGKHSRIVGSTGFNRNRTYEQSHDTSKARFDYYQAKRVADRKKQTASPSYNWVLEAIKVSKKNLDPARNAAITIPVLLFQPAEDSSVIPEKENEFIAQVIHGRMEFMPHSRHEVYAAVDEDVIRYLDLIEKFYAE